MHTFEYRLPRVPADFSIDFVLGPKSHGGRCKDVSVAGIRAELDNPPAVGSTGLLILRYPQRVLNLAAQITHSDEHQVGISFLVHSQKEKKMIVEFVADVARQASASEPERVR